MTDKVPVVLVFAGPNGSGKSTITKGFDIIGKYINADEIKKEDNCTDLEAAQKATSLREKALSEGQDFTFETVLSSQINIELLEKAKKSGYRIEIVYVLTADVEININRIKCRVLNGGHDVPEDKIRSRYIKSLANIPKLLSIADVIRVVDNSSDAADGKAHIIISKKDTELIISECEYWSKEKIYKLIFGK